MRLTIPSGSTRPSSHRVAKKPNHNSWLVDPPPRGTGVMCSAKGYHLLHILGRCNDCSESVKVHFE